MCPYWNFKQKVKHLVLALEKKNFEIQENELM